MQCFGKIYPDIFSLCTAPRGRDRETFIHLFSVALCLAWADCAQLMAQGAWRRKFVSEMSLQLRLHLPSLSLPISSSSIDGCQQCAEPALPLPCKRSQG